jgi:glycosyltransferase involved in cell wall biosynthesis
MAWGMTLHILTVTRGLPVHTKGGMESVAWDLARAFARAGHRSSVITAAHPDLPAFGVIDGVEVATARASAKHYTAAWWRETRRVFEARYASGVDVVLGVSAAANGIVEAGVCAAPVIFQAHGTSSGEVMSKLRSGSPKAMIMAGKNIYWGLFKDRIYRDYDGVVAVGEAVMRQLTQGVSRHLVGSTPVTLIKNGIDATAFAFDPAARGRVRALYNIPPESRLILSLSRLHVQKGVSETLEAFALAREAAPDLRLLIAGEGPHEADLKRRASDLGLGSVVQFAGGVERGEVAGILSASDVLAFPTLRVEGAPMTVLEALASGLPVITTAQGAAADLPCRRVPVGDGKALRDAMLEVRLCGLDRPTLLPSNYTLADTAQAYLKLFDSLLSG